MLSPSGGVITCSMNRQLEGFAYSPSYSIWSIQIQGVLYMHTPIFRESKHVFSPFFIYIDPSQKAEFGKKHGV